MHRNRTQEFDVQALVLALLIDRGRVSFVDIGGHIGYRGYVEIEREILSLDSHIF